MDVVYNHVNLHIDRLLLWHQLTLVQQLNCICDNLAKTAVHRSLCMDRHRDDDYLLPRENAALFVDGIKQTSNPGRSIRYATGKAEAKVFLVGKMKWTKEKFNEVAWEWLDATLHNKPDMFRVWLQQAGYKIRRFRFGFDNVSGPNMLPLASDARIVRTDGHRLRMYSESASAADRSGATRSVHALFGVGLAIQ